MEHSSRPIPQVPRRPTHSIIAHSLDDHNLPAERPPDEHGNVSCASPSPLNRPHHAPSSNLAPEPSPGEHYHAPLPLHSPSPEFDENEDEQRTVEQSLKDCRRRLACWEIVGFLCFCAATALGIASGHIDGDWAYLVTGSSLVLAFATAWIGWKVKSCTVKKVELKYDLLAIRSSGHALRH